MTSPKVGERDVCLGLLRRVNRTNSRLTVIGDKGYAGKDFELAADDLTPSPSNATAPEPSEASAPGV